MDHEILVRMHQVQEACLLQAPPAYPFPVTMIGCSMIVRLCTVLSCVGWMDWAIDDCVNVDGNIRPD